MRGRLPGCRARPLSGRRRLIPHSRRRASALHQGDVLRQHVWSPRWNGQATGPYALPCMRAWRPARPPCWRRPVAVPPPAPPLLRSSPNTLAHRRARPVIGVARRRIQAGGLRSRGCCSRPLSLSRPRAWTSLARSTVYGTGAAKSRGPRSRGRGAALALRSRVIAGQSGLLPVHGPCWLGRNRAEGVAVWPHGDG